MKTGGFRVDTGHGGTLSTGCERCGRTAESSGAARWHRWRIPRDDVPFGGLRSSFSGTAAAMRRRRSRPCLPPVFARSVALPREDRVKTRPSPDAALRKSPNSQRSIDLRRAILSRSRPSTGTGAGAIVKSSFTRVRAGRHSFDGLSRTNLVGGCSPPKTYTSKAALDPWFPQSRVLFFSVCHATRGYKSDRLGPLIDQPERLTSPG